MSNTKGQFGFFDLDDFFPKLNSLLDWELFRPSLQKMSEKEHHVPGGRPPYGA